MDTVIWWEEDDRGRPVRFQVVGPGSPPLSEELWVHYSFDGRPAPEGWAHLTTTSFQDLSRTARDAVARPPAPGGGTLQQLVIAPDDQVRGRYEHVDMAGSGFLTCQQEARSRLAERLTMPPVAQRPGHSGVWLSRVRMVQGRVTLDAAPVAAPDGGRAGPSVRVFRFERPRFGVQLGNDAVTWCTGDMEAAARTRHHVLAVQLDGDRDGQRDGQPPAELPAVTWDWPLTIDEGPSACQWQPTGLHVTRPRGQTGHIVVEVRVPLPECNWSLVCEQWQDPAAFAPVGIMTLSAPLPR